ncbi:galactose oxidase-like domain-containing protein [Pseudonocardia sp.]|uniref:galactose oxidase-like domain-containing protein n=1 Tax=Pseudonocardia sp. TaxID=60912 RepID=UPI003D0B6E3F
MTWLRTPTGRKWRRIALLVVIPLVLIGVNVAPAMAFVSQMRHQMLVDSDDYKRQYGHWDVVDLPDDMEVNAIHAALLPTGKLLIIAGSGNDTEAFQAGTFRTLIYDPATGGTKLVPTPADLFCGGHAFLPDGKLLVAGGTQRYEVLPPDVTKAAGGMLVKNESPDVARSLPKGTVFVAPNGLRYLSTADVTLPPAAKTSVHTRTTVTASQDTVWVEAEAPGPQYATTDRQQYSVAGLADANDVYGIADKMTFDKQEFQGIADSYEFDPVTESYQKVGSMNHKRWYPTLVGLPDNGGVIAVSGLDGTGQVVDGYNEVYDARTRTWVDRPDLRQYFPTYPALFPTQRGELFYSGSNAGYGPDDKGRTPGFWNLADNTFRTVPGLRDPDMLETSGSTWAGTVQNQKVMVVGGGGVGESDRSTARIDVVDLTAPHPAFTPGPSLPQGTRYPNLVTLPDDTTLITGGSSGYRGEGASDNLTARIYHPDTNTLSDAADPSVGRDYHSEALLLPDGRVATLGSNPLFKDAANTKPGAFEKRIEIYTPAYLYRGTRPQITDAPPTVATGATMTVSTPDAARIASARLIRPSAVTHVTDVEQRSVALDVTRADDALSVTVPADGNIVPPGFYMLFLVADDGTPSVARWVQVT